MLGKQLKAMLLGVTVAPHDLAEAFDAARPDERIEAAFALDRTAQRALYELAAGSAALNLADFVPSDRGALHSVRHRGRNTLPLPGSHKYFEKRFCRPAHATDRLFGYNEAPSRRLIGPGYFVARETLDAPEWAARGSVVIDYFQVPDEPVAAGWPPVVPNTRGLQRFIYHQTRDFMRRVSQHVTIGAAYKREEKLDHYFILVRQDD